MRMDCQQDLEWALGLNRILLNFIGVWPITKSSKNIRKEYLKNFRIPLIVIYIILTAVLPGSYAFIKIFPRLPLVIDNLSTNSAAIVSTIKIFLLWVHRRVLEDTANTAINHWMKSKNHWERDIMIKQARRARIFTSSGYVVVFCSVAGFGTAPLLGLNVRLVNNITDLAGDRYFPIQTYYPYDFTKTPYFELTYFSILLAGFFVGIGFSVPDNFFGAIVLHTSAQCEILGIKLKRLLPNSEEDTGKIVSFNVKIARLVNYHVHLISGEKYIIPHLNRLVEDIERSFNSIILVHVLCMSVMTCCIGFGFIKMIKSQDEDLTLARGMVLVVFLLTSMVHTLIYCIAGEILSNHSFDIADCIYSSNWYLFSSKYSRDLLPVLVRAQDPLKLTAGKFIYLSLGAYLNFLKSSAGYISMLLTIGS